MVKTKTIKLLFTTALGILSLCIFLAPHQAFAGSCSSNGVGTSWNTAADWTGTCTGTGGKPGTGDTVTIAASHPITLDVATPVLASLTINSTLDTNSSSNFGVNTAKLTIGSTGTLTANASTITLSGTSGTLFTLTTGGTLSAGTSTVSLSGSSGSATVASGSPTFYNLTSSGNAPRSLGEALTVSNTLALNQGSLDTTSGGHYTVTAGHITFNFGTFTPQSSTVNITGTSGTLFTLSSGTFTAGTSTVNLTGNGSATINSGTPTFYNLTSSGTGTKSLGGALGVSNTLTISNGTFDTTSANDYTVSAGQVVINGGTFTPQASSVNLSGASGTLFTLSSGTFTAGTSTVNLTGNGSTTLNSGSPTFYNVTLAGSGTETLGAGITIGGTLFVQAGIFDPSTYKGVKLDSDFSNTQCS